MHKKKNSKTHHTTRHSDITQEDHVVYFGGLALMRWINPLNGSDNVTPQFF